MTVRAKMFVQSVTKSDWGTSVSMHAVYSDTGEDKDFAAATPSANLNIFISPGYPAESMFELNKQYYVDISKAN